MTTHRNNAPSPTDHPERDAVDPIVTRRRFLAGAALLSAGFAVGCADPSTGPLAGGAITLSRNEDDDEGDARGRGRRAFDHVIVVMMENRSFDHMLGWVPKADGRQAGLRYTDRDGIVHHTFALAPDFQGCGFNDPDHSYTGGRVQFNDGRCDGFLRSGHNDVYAIGYYRRNDLDFFGRAIGDWTTSDRYFCSILGPTFPNRFYQHAGQTDRISNTAVVSQLPTIWDRLAAAGLTGRYYFSDLAFTALWGAKYQTISRPFTQFLDECASGTLPNVAFVDPKFGGEGDGTSIDDHPFGDIRAGQHFLHQIYTAVTTGPGWERTVLVINYDEWGGFFDHVPPPVGALSATARAAGYTDGRLGFRTPLLVVSPFARPGHVAHEVYDHTSILKMIENRWQLAPLSDRDAAARDLSRVLDFGRSPRTAPQYPAPPIVTGAPCPPSAVVAASAAAGSDLLVAGTPATARDHWRALRNLAAATGWR